MLQCDPPSLFHFILNGVSGLVSVSKHIINLLEIPKTSVCVCVCVCSFMGKCACVFLCVQAKTSHVSEHFFL